MHAHVVAHSSECKWCVVLLTILEETEESRSVICFGCSLKERRRRGRCRRQEQEQQKAAKERQTTTEDWYWSLRLAIPIYHKSGYPKTVSFQSGALFLGNGWEVRPRVKIRAWNREPISHCAKVFFHSWSWLGPWFMRLGNPDSERKAKGFD